MSRDRIDGVVVRNLDADSYVVTIDPSNEYDLQFGIAAGRVGFLRRRWQPAIVVAALGLVVHLPVSWPTKNEATADGEHFLRHMLDDPQFLDLIHDVVQTEVDAGRIVLHER